jgi:gliding motility-associated-like protein
MNSAIKKFDIMISRKLNLARRTFLISVSLLVIAFSFSKNNLYGQLVVGSPGSFQSATVECAPAQYTVYYQYIVNSPAGFPSGFFRLTFRLDRQDGTNISIVNRYYGFNGEYTITILAPGDPGNFTGKYMIQGNASFTMPVLEESCQYNVNITFRQDPDGNTGGVVWQGIDATQTQPLSNWHTDDLADGTIAITPLVKEVCEGEGLVNFLFRDASAFACTTPFPGLSNPNTTERYVQFVYGTSVAGGIPNVSINVYGTTQFLTDATGAPIVNFTVDPRNGAVVGAYTTTSGFFEGPVIPTGTSQRNGSQQAFPISYPAGGTVVGDYFEVTLRNWNYCNPWNGEQPYPRDGSYPDPTTPKTATARILVVGAPAAPAILDKTICHLDNRTLTITNGPPVGQYWWYRDAGLTDLASSGTATSYTQPETAVGTYNYYVYDQSLAGLLCKSPVTHVTLTINPIPNAPSITRNNPDFCFDGTSSIILTANPNSPPAVSGYQWYRNGTEVSGATSSTITLSTVAQSGTYTCISYGVAPTNCPSPLSNSITVTIGLPATVNAGPATATTCSDTPYNTTGATFGGGASSVTWTTSGNGTFGSTTTAVTTYTPGSSDITAGTVTLTLTTNDPVTACPAVSDFLTLTVVKAPVANAGTDAIICRSGTFQVTDASVTNQASFSWSIVTGTGSLNSTAVINPIYTPSAGDAGTVVRLRLTAVGNAPCASGTDDKLLTVDYVPTASVGAAQNICGTTATVATLSGNALTNGATGYWSFNTIWRENFNDLANGTTVDAGPTAWSYSGVPTDWARVESKRFEAKETDNWIIWSSQVIDISTATNVGVAVRLIAGTTNDAGADYMRVYYKINGGLETALTNGLQTGAFGTVLATASNLSGNNIQIVVRILNNSDNEYYWFDDVIVTEGSAAAITDPSSPTSTVTNLPVGATTFTWTVSSANGGCTPASANLIITRDVQPTAAAAGPDQAFCETTSATLAATAADNGGSGLWSHFAGPAGYTITTPASPTSTVTGLSYGAHTFRWTVSSALGICANTIDDVIITRNQNPDDKTIAVAASPICYNSSTNINIPASQAGIRYDLYKTVGSVFVASVNGVAGVQVSVSTGALTANTSFYVVAVNTTTLCQRTLNTVTVNVDAATVAGSVTGGSTVCQGSTSALLTLSGYTGTIQRWEYRYDNGGGFGLWTTIVHTNPTYTSFALSAGTYQFRAAVKSGVCSELTSASTTVTVDPTTVGGTVNGSTSVCQGSNSGLLSLVAKTGVVLNWEYRYDNGGGFGIWNNIANTGTTYTSGALSAGTYEFRAVVQSGTCLVAYSNPATIIVEPTLLPGSIGSDQSLCDPANPALFTQETPAGGGLAVLTYQWKSSLVSGGPYGNIGGATGITYDAPGGLAVTTYYVRTVTSAGVCGSVNSNEVRVIVNPGPTSEVKLLTGPASACKDAAITMNYQAVADADQYIWDYSWVAGDNNATTATPTINIDLTGVAAGAHTIKVAGINGCNIVPYPWSLTHNLTIYTIPNSNAGSDNSICGSLTIALNATASVGTGTWTKVSGPGTVTFSNANSATSTATVSLYGSYELKWTVNNGGCIDDDNVIIIYYQQPTVTAPVAQNLCNTKTTTLTATGFSYQVGSTNWRTYQWAYVSGPDATPTFGTPTAISTTAAVDFYGDYVFSITETNGTCSDVKTVAVRYAEQPTVTAPAAQNLCNTKSTSVTATGHTYSGGSNVNWRTYQWAYVSGPDATPTFGSATALTTTIDVDFYGDYVFSITETNGACSNVKTVAIRFAEQPTVTAPAAQDLCGVKTTTLTATGHTYSGGSNVNWRTYQWAYVSGPDATPTFGTGTAISTTALVDFYGDYVFSITETNGACSNTKTVAVRYAEQPTVTAPVAQNLCNTKTTTLTATGHSYSGGSNVNWHTYQWAYVSGPDATPTFGTPTAVSTTAAVDFYGDYVFSITETNGACSNVKTVAVRYAEQPTVTAPAAQDLCGTLSTSLTAIGHTYTGGSNVDWHTYQWTYVSGPDNTPTFATGTALTTTAAVDLYGDYVFRITETNGACSNSKTVAVRYAQQPTVTAPVAQNLCNTKTTTLTATGFSYQVGSTNWRTYQWAYVSGPDATPTFGTPTAISTTAAVDFYGDYVFSITETNGTCSDVKTVAVRYAEQPTVTAPAAQNLCNTKSTSVTATGHTYSGGSNVNWRTYQWAYVSGPDATPTFGSATALTTTIDVDFYGDYVFSITETNGACSNVKTVAIRFAEQPTVTAPAAQDLCGVKTTTLTATGHTYSGGSNVNWRTYQWAYVSGPDATPTFGTGTAISTTALVDFYGDYVFSITETNGACSNTKTVAVRYAEQPTVTAPVAQNLCNTKTTTLTATGHSYSGGSNVNWHTYQWAYVSGPDATPTFGTPTAISTTAAVDFYGDYVFSITETNGACSNVKTVAVRYAEQPTVTAPAAQDLCGTLSTSLTAIGHTYTGGSNVDWHTYQWTYVSGPDNTPTFATGTALTTTAAVDLYGDYVFRITETNGACSNSKTVAVRYAQQPTVTAPIAQNLCNTKTTTLTATGFTYQVGSTNFHTYQWAYVSGPDATPTFGTPTAISTTAAVDFYGDYVFSITETNGTCSDVKTVAVRYSEQPTADGGTNNEINAALTYTMTAVPYTYAIAPNQNSGTYTWLMISSTTGGVVTSWGSGITTPTPTITVDKYGEYVFRWTETNGTCSSFENITLKFVEGVSAGPDQDLCNTLTTTLAGNTPSAGTGTWTKISGSGTVNFIDGVNNPLTQIVVSQYDSYVLQWTFSVGVPPFNQDQVTIDFNEKPTVNAGMNYNICFPPAVLPALPAITLSGTIGGGATSGTWSVIANGAGSFGASTTTAPNVTATYTLHPSDAGKTITFRLTTDDPAGACPAEFDEVDVIINPMPNTSPITGPAILCTNESNKVYQVSLPRTPGSTYVWNVPAGLTITSPPDLYFIIVDATGPTAPGAKITVTETLPGPTFCTGIPVEFPVVVTTAKLGEVVSGPPSVCEGSTLNNYSVSFTTGSTYSWSLPPGAFITTVPANQSSVDVSFPINFSGTVSVVETNGACTTFHTGIPVTVNPRPILSSSLTPPAICSATSFDYTATSAAASPSFAWTRAGILGINGGTGSAGPGNVNEVLTNTTTAPISVTYVYVTTAAGCTGNPQNVVVVVNPAGQVNDPADQIFCKNNVIPAITFSTVNSGGTTTYTWTNSETGIGLATNGTGNIPSFTAANPGTTQLVATITVTPKFTNGSLDCFGTPQTFTITVNPLGQVTNPGNIVVCNTGTVGPINWVTTNTDGITTYTWTNSDPTINLAASGTGNIASFAATNSGTSPVVATITVTPHYANGSLTCDGTPIVFSITVNPTGQVNDPANQVVCKGAPVSAIAFGTINTGGITEYTWTNTETGIGLAGSGTGNIGSFTATNITTEPLTATITVIPTFKNGGTDCVGSSESFTITVNPTAQVDDPANQVVCNGGTTSLVAFNTVNTVGTTTYSWTNSATGIGLPATGVGDIAPFVVSNITTAPVVATITVTPHFTYGSVTCNGPVQTFTITVNPTAQVNDPVNQVVCNGEPIAAVNFTTNNTTGITSYAWTNSDISIGLAASGTTDIGVFSPVNPGTAPVIATIVVTPLFTYDGESCSGPSQSFTITVNPTGQVNDPVDQVVCNGAFTAPVTFSTANTIGTTTYTWTNDKISIGLGAGGSGNIPTFMATNATGTPVIATIEVTPHFAYGSVTCDGPVKTFTITVNPTAQVTNPGNQVVCNNTMTSLVSFVTTNTGGIPSYAWSNNDVSIGLAASGTGNIPPFLAENTGTLPVTATITVIPSYENDGVTCIGPVKTFNITVNPTAQVNDPADKVVCKGSVIPAINFNTINTGGTTAYTWTNSAPGIGLAGGGTGMIGSFTALNAGTTPIIATIEVFPEFTNGGETCTGPSQTFTITVNPTAQVEDPADLVVCNGVNTLNIAFTTLNTIGATSYSWSNNTTSIGLAASGTDDIAPFAAINTGTSPVTATITVTPLFTYASLTCSGPAKTFTITVNPSAKVNDPADMVVCNGVNSSPVVFTTTNTGGTTAYTWTNDNIGIGLIAGDAGNLPSFLPTNVTNAPITATITVTPQYTNAGETCSGTAQTFTITVNPSAQVDDPADQKLCNGDMSAAVAFTTSNTVGTTTYSWTNNTPGIGLSAAGTGTIPAFAVSNITSAPVIATITVTPHFTYGSVTCNGPAQTFTITVNPTAQVNDPVNQVVCHNTSVPALVFTTLNTVGITSYSWANSNTAIGLGASGIGDLPAFTADNTTTSPISGTITVTPSFTYDGKTCTGPAQTFTITVNPAGQVIQPADQVVCNGTSTANVIFSTLNTGGATSYEWTNDNVTIGLGASGSGNIPFFTALNTGMAPEVANIEVTPYFTNGTVTCAGTPATFKITVNPTAQVNVPADQVVCNNTLTTAITFTTNNTVGVTTYTWTNSNPGINLAASGTTDNIPAFNATNGGSAPVIATISVTPHYLNAGKNCDGPAQTFTITVNPTAQVNDPADQVVCKGSSTLAVNFITSRTGGVTVYNWTNDNTAIGLAGSGTGPIASFTATNTTAGLLTGLITVTPTYTNDGQSCTGPSQTFTITVNPTALVDDVTNQVVCNGDETTDVVFSTTNTGGSMTYNWTNTATSIGLASMGTGDIPKFTAINNGTSPVVATITVTPQFTNGSVTCSGPSKTFTITVNPTAQVNDPANLVVCNTDNISVTFVTANTGGLTTYAWTNTAPGIGLLASGTGNSIAFIASNASTAPVTATITVTPTFTNGVACTGPAQTFTITVNPTGQVTDPADQVVCNSSFTAPVNFATINTGGTTTYTWTNDQISIGLAASGTGNISAFPAVNTGTSPVTATITVTPHFSNSLVTCVGPAQTFTIIVNPTAQVTDPADQVVCNGAPVSAVNFVTVNTGGATTFAWTNSATGMGLAASGTGNITAFTASNASTAPIVATITVTPTFNNGLVNCTGPAQTFTITVNPTGQVNDPANQVVCNGASATAINFTTANTGGTTTYNWVNDSPSIGLAAVGSGNIAAFTAVNSGVTPVVATITVTPQFANGSVTCSGPAETFTITVNPTPNVSTASPLTICSATTTNIALTSNIAGATYTWTVGAVSGGITGASASSGSTIAQILINPGTTPGSVTYAVTPTAGGCPGLPVNITVVVNPTPNVSTVGPTTICSATSTNIALSSSVAGTTFTWTIGTITGGITGATPAGGANIAQILTNPGTTAGTVEYIVTPIANSCPGIPVSVVITVNPTPDVTTASVTTICNATTTNIALASGVAGTTFSWTIGGVTGSVSGATASNGTTIAQTLYNTGLTPGTVTYIVTPTANSCAGLPTNIIVTVNPSTGPTSFTTGAMEVCQDAPDETYTATATNSTSILYSVLPAAAGTINATTGIMDWAPAFFGNATITATSAGLCGTTVGTVTVRVKRLPSIATSPAAAVTCEFGQVNFDVTANGSDLSYEWQVDPNTGTFATVTGGIYSGIASSTLQIWSADRTMNNYKYRVVVSGCLPDVTSASALLTVNTAPELTVHPKDSVICLGAGTTMKAASLGTGIVWTWYVNKGTGGFVPVVADTHFSFATTVSSDTTKTTLTITDALATYNNWIFRAQAKGTCGAAVNTNFARLSVTNPPVVALHPVLKAICENGSTNFLGNGSGYLSLQWQVSTNNGATWTYITDDAVTYVGAATNQLSVLNAPVALSNNRYRLAFKGSCTTVYSNGATLTVNPNPIVNFVTDVNACGGVPVVLNGNPSGGTLPYAQHRWTGDVGPLNLYTVQSPTFSSQISGTYNLVYKVTDSKTCTASDTLRVIVDSPSAEFTQDIDNGCTPLIVKYTKDMTGIAKFWWDFNDGSPLDSLQANPEHTFKNSSKTAISYYNVKLKVRSPGGCIKTYTSLVTVYPAVKATFTATTDTICSGKTVTFTGISGASKYFWEYGDAVSAYAGSNSTHLYINSGTTPLDLNVKLTTTSFYNCTADTTIKIVVMPVPVAQFSADPVSQVYKVGGNPVTFTNLTNAGNWNYLWNFDDGTTSTAKDPTLSFADLGTYKVTLEVTNGSCTDKVMHEVSVTPKAPIASFDKIPDGCEPVSFTAVNTSQNTEIPGTTYFWEFGDGGISTAKNPQYTYFDPGIYVIKLTVRGPGGKDEAQQTIHVNPSPKAYFEVAPLFVFVNDEKIRGFNLSQGADYYVWEFGDGDTSHVKEPFHKYMEPGVFDITLSAYSNNGCYDKYILSPGVTVEPAGEIRFSTVFTPNKDGEIDGDMGNINSGNMDMFFYPPIQEKVQKYKLQIFNRLGLLLFESRNINKAWNGYYKGKLCPQGVYIWYVEGKYNNGEPFKKVGDVTLLH